MVESSEYIGKCPVCREELRKRDIEEVVFGIIIGIPPLAKRAQEIKCFNIYVRDHKSRRVMKK